MPYIRDRDFARINELLQTIKQLAEKEGYRSIPDIAIRALKTMDKYIVETEEERDQLTKAKGNKVTFCVLDDTACNLIECD